MSTVMHTRRVQKLGGSSLVVTLPKNWVKRMNVKAGDNLIVIDEGEYLKIMPAHIPSNSRSLSLKLTHTLSKPENIKLMVTCSYIHGYDKILIYNDKIPKTLKGSVKSVKADGAEKIEDVIVSEDMVVIELSKGEETPLHYQFKKLANMINSAIDMIYSNNLEEARRAISKASTVIEDILRSASKAEISFCEPSKASMALGAMIALPKILSEVIEASTKLSVDERRMMLEKLRRTLLELLGGLSSHSTKRIETASLESSRLAEEALQASDKEFAAYLRSAAYLIDTIARTSICGLAIEENIA